jgi:hypothetical protein
MASEAYGIDYVDVSMVDRVIRQVSVHEPGGTVHEKTLRQEIPEEILMAAKSKRGELDGKVTVSASLADSIEYGYKAEAFVSISLSCENTVEACQELHGAIQPVVHNLVRQDQAMAAQMRDDILAARNGPPASQGQVSSPPTPTAPAMPRFVR